MTIMAATDKESTGSPTRKVLVLHGNRQTGQLLLGRMDKLRKKLQRMDIALVAPDAPCFHHPDDTNMRQWWARRDGNHCEGLEESIQYLEDLWKSDSCFEGILGFSQGARMAHLAAVLARKNENMFKGLKYVIMVAGYDAPLPDNWNPMDALDIPSLHVWGEADRLITPTQSQAVLKYYHNPQQHVHEGGHHVPMRAASVTVYLDFIKRATIKPLDGDNTASASSSQPANPNKSMIATIAAPTQPDEETIMAQQDEVEALSAIFPDEFTLLSKQINDKTYKHPIRYRIDLPPSEMGLWPPHPISLIVEYPPDYPSHSFPIISLEHNNNMMEFSSGHTQMCLTAIREAAEAEQGMPCVLSCAYAAREFFESGSMRNDDIEAKEEFGSDAEQSNDAKDDADAFRPTIQPASPERIQECNLQGLEIAWSLLQENAFDLGKGGSWRYTIGLVGKPSAGKSTFFNAATGFARQRNDKENELGGATMAPHPFTTIDPNVGYCLVPAPEQSCPEEDCDVPALNVGCTHGRDSKGRRLLPVMIKDVAGLVPGAYQGRGRGNKFLNDLTDADVLIHVVDSSGSADTEGNVVGCDGEMNAAGSHPLNDLSWIRNELVEWVYANLMFKWNNIQRRGRSKLSDMFSGYGQSQAVVAAVLLAVERFMDTMEQRDHALDHLNEWDQGDVHRLVSTFLGVRFPMALALNKSDISSAAANVRDVQRALPVDGALVGVPLSARNEMLFVKNHLQTSGNRMGDGSIPVGVWQCLQSSISLRAPVLVFPVVDMTTLAPLPGLLHYATLDASLPSAGMISCLRAAGGSAPSLWNDDICGYDPTMAKESSVMLRDALIMKQGSTVEDVFLSLKNMGALGGEFVRAEGMGRIGEKAKLIPKHELISRRNCILKIMTNKRTQWQTK